MDLLIGYGLVRGVGGKSGGTSSRRELFDGPPAAPPAQEQQQPQQQPSSYNDRPGQGGWSGGGGRGGWNGGSGGWNGGRNGGSGGWNGGGNRSAWTAGGVILAVVLLLLWVLLFAIPAAYLSWTSNRLIGWHPAMCVFFAIFAFLDGFSYLLSYLIFKLDLVAHIQTRCGGAPPQPQPAPPPPQPAQAGGCHRHKK